MRKNAYCTFFLILTIICPTLAQVGEWTERGSIENGRSAMATVVYNDTLFVIGGNTLMDDINAPTNEVLRFDLNDLEAEIEPATSMNYARQGASALVHEGIIYVFGGRIGTENKTELIEAYNPHTGIWYSPTEEFVATIPPEDMERLNREGMSAVIWNYKPLLAGGASGLLDLHNDLFAITPRLQGQEDERELVFSIDVLDVTLPVSVSYHSFSRLTFANVEEKFFLAGGYSRENNSSIFAWDGSESSEFISTTYPITQYGESISAHATVATKINGVSSLVFIGGNGVGQERTLCSVRSFDDDGIPIVVSTILDTLSDLPIRRAYLKAVELPDNGSGYPEILVIGGSRVTIEGGRYLYRDMISANVFRIETDIEEETRALLPSSPVVTAAPNPFNGAVRISVELGDSEEAAQFSVYNVLGQLVQHWSEEPNGSGQVVTFWSGVWGGRPAPGGIYFLKVQQGSKRSIIKLHRLP